MNFEYEINAGGRIVICSSHLGHLSNIDGREPLASKLRDKFVDPKLTEDELDKLIKQFANHAKVRFPFMHVLCKTASLQITFYFPLTFFLTAYEPLLEHLIYGLIGSFIH